jgi:hypothetical protein
MPAHKDIGYANAHIPYSFQYADEAAREAATGFAAGDVGKFARQLDDNSIWMLTDDSPVTWTAVGGSGGGAGHGYYQYLAAALEPDAIEPLEVGSFAYVVASNEVKLLLASFATKLGSTGRMEVRDPNRFMSLCGVTLNGLGSSSAAALLDPALPAYADPRETYYDRMLILTEAPLRTIDVVDPATFYPFLLGAYGGIVLRVVNFDFDYISVQNNNGSNGLNLGNETNDTEAQRLDNAMTLALNKLVATELYAGAERSADAGRGTVVFFLCPADWSAITDPNTYDFRDDFMGSALDTATDWTRAQSSAGNVEIVVLYQWLKMLGTTTWGQNAAYSQASIARAAGKIFLIDIYTGRNATANNSHMVGFSDGGGQSYTNFAHGVLFTSSGAANILKVYENGNDRGTVGSGYANGTIYRVRITLGASDATYEIQGGAYGALGSNDWTDITPGTSSSSTTPVHAGFSAGQTGTMYLSDPRIY